MSVCTLHRLIPARLRRTFCALSLALLAGSLRAADLEAPRHFDIPAEPAGPALRKFVQQAGVELLYSSGMLEHVTTQAVRGDMPPRPALERMLAGTGLVVTQGANNGALVVTRAAPPSPSPDKKKVNMTKSSTVFSRLAAILVAAGAAGASAQTDTPAPAPASPSSPEEVVQMTRFEVTTTQGHGYVSTNAATGFKTNESLLDIPQEDTVVTRDLITDLNYASSSDILQFFGLNDLYQGEYFEARGYRIAYAYVDEIPEIVPQEDNVNIDSYEIIKGPAQVLYLAAPLGGTVLKATKKPLPIVQDLATLSLDSWGLWRATIDSTGPIGEVGGAKILYRLVLANQDGNSYFVNFKDRREVLFPAVEVDYKDTIVRTNYTYQRLLHTSEGTDLITPSGELYTGAGRRVANIPQNDLVDYEINRYFVEILHHVSDSWEDRLQAGVTTQLTYGPVAFASGGIDWGKQTETYNGRLDNIRYTYWTVQDDVQGHYHIGPIKNGDAFGFGYSDQTIKQELWTTAWPTPVTVAMNSEAAINSIPMPTASQFYPPANEGGHQETIISAIYWQHSIDVIPNWLSLVGGWTWSDITTANTANVSTLPWLTTTEPFQDVIHRIGVVFHPIKEVSIYALNSTVFAPPASGTTLENGTLPPPQDGTGNEIGIKTALMGGRISTSFAWFNMTTTNVLQFAGILPNGLNYSIIVGNSVQEGVDGDVAVAVVPGYQIIGSFYAGHDRAANGTPIATSYDNSWGLFNRYDFSKASALKGLAIGAGVARVGGRYISDAGLNDAVLTPFETWSGMIKLKTGTLLNAFATYNFARHWHVRVSAANLLNQAYASGAAATYFVDPSPPTTFTFEIGYKY